MRQAKELRLKVGGHKVAALDFWGRGEPILCFHGWLDNAESFRPLAQALPHHHLIAIDFPGHGRSFRLPSGVRQHYLDLIPFIFQVMQALKLNKVSAIGHSMGAGVISLASGVFPEKFHKLILIEGLGPLTTPIEELPQHMAFAIQNAERKLLHRIRYYPTKKAAIEVRAKAGNIGKPAAQLLAKRGVSKSKYGYYWNSDARLKEPSLYRLCEEQVLAFLKRIAAPVLLLRAKETLPHLLPYFERRQPYVAKLSYQILPGNHHLHMLNPLPVAQAIEHFLK